jgi:multimeric flavodoxin WrbA
MKVLGVIGGSRINGNTAKLVEEVLAGAREASHETILFRLADMDVGHIGDNYGEVIFPNDDFEGVKPHIETMGTLVLGAPIWFGTVDSRTHAFIQRLYYYSEYYDENNRLLWPACAKAVNIITYGQSDPHHYDGVLAWLKDIEKGFGMIKIRAIIAENTSENPVENRRALLKKAREMGKKL